MIHHALVLNLHQPSGNLAELWDQQNWEARQILWALDRIPRSLWDHEDIARVHISLSGTLLEQLTDPDFQGCCYGAVKLGDLLWFFQNQRIFDILGTGFYHPVFPLIPQSDWFEQGRRWQAIARHLFWRNTFNGFWPPEMGFCEEMIPMLRQLGYQYVLVDNEYVEPLGDYNWSSQRYRPYLASFGGKHMIVIPRDRELSNAQLSGMDPEWFVSEIQQRTRHCDFQPLVTTATDGDNGGWFRNQDGAGNFWTGFYGPFIERIRSGGVGVKPCFIHEYIRRFGHGGPCRVHRGAWNTENHRGNDFHQWTWSTAQQDGLKRIHDLRNRLEIIEQSLPSKFPAGLPQHLMVGVESVRWRILRAETSCNFYWGENWVHKANADLDAAEEGLVEIGVSLV